MEKLDPLKSGDWYNSQKNWLNKNLHSKIITVVSGHFIQLDRPRYVCEQIKALVDLSLK